MVIGVLGGLAILVLGTVMFSFGFWMGWLSAQGWLRPEYQEGVECERGSLDYNP